MNDNELSYQPSRIVTVTAEQAGQRIDNFLFNQLKHIPKTRIYKMLRKGEVRVNKGRIKPVYKIQPGDQIRLPPVQMKESLNKLSPSLDRVRSLEQRIIYESDRLIILNKPSGVAVHGGSGDSFGVIESLRALRPDASFLELVHRLDKLTSGCLMVAKRRSTLRYLHEQLRERRIRKTYLCWVHGDWQESNLTVNKPLSVVKFKNGDRRAVVDDAGKSSKTVFRRLEGDTSYTLLQASPHTGRMHQIRVHCASQGHAICGDSKYSNDPKQADSFDRLYLHAHKLVFSETPDSELKEISCKSASFEKFLVKK